MGRPEDTDTTGQAPASGVADSAVLLFDADGVVVGRPHAAEQLLGHSPAVLRGRPVESLLAPDEVARLPAIVERCTKDGAWSGVLLARHHDGRHIAVDITLVPLPEGETPARWLAVAAGAAPSRQWTMGPALLERMVTDAPVGLALVDTDLRCVWSNTALEHFGGGRADERRGRRIAEIQPGLNADLLESKMRQVLDSGTPVTGYEHVGRTRAAPGQDRAHSMSIVRLEDDDGRPIGVCYAVVDITERYRARLRLALMALASERIGRSLDIAGTAQDLSDVAVPGLADVVAVDLLDSVIRGAEPPPGPTAGAAAVRLVRAGVQTVRAGASETVVEPGEEAAYLPTSPQIDCLAHGRSWRAARLDAAARESALPARGRAVGEGAGTGRQGPTTPETTQPSPAGPEPAGPAQPPSADPVPPEPAGPAPAGSASAGPAPAQPTQTGPAPAGPAPAGPPPAHPEPAGPAQPPSVDPVPTRSADPAQPPSAPRPSTAPVAHTAMVVPILARGVTLGVATFFRSRRDEPFDEDDLRLAEELVARAAVCLDNARRYTRERAAALVLQRSLLPHGVPQQEAVDAASFYRPADELSGLGGDWFDVIPLSGARVALVVGEVPGHGIEAAATMGQLRTAVRTLADLDLSAEELLAHLDDLVLQATREGRRAGIGGEANLGAVGASCLYAVYDPVSLRCELASAGHLAPVVVAPDGTVEFPELPPGPALGIGGLPFESVELPLQEGTVLAFYTEGLFAAPGTGKEGLGSVLRSRDLPLDELCRSVVDELAPSRPYTDDAALLLVRTRSLASGQVAAWDLPADPAVVARSRVMAARQLTAWGLEELAFTTELVVSELVTNAIRHASGPIRLRLILERTLICEVFDASSTAPHLRHARTTDEGGRGLFLISQFTRRWGTRYTAEGKVIWAEQPLDGDPAEPDATPPE